MNSLTAYFDTALNDHKSRRFVITETAISIVTIISVISIVLETVPSLHRFEPVFLGIEWVCVIIFTAEYLARLATSPKKLKYIFSVWGLIDLVAILPTYLGLGNWTFLKSARTLRLLRLLRILRIAKISRAYLESQEGQVKAEGEFNRLNLVIYFLALFSAALIFGAALYAVEHRQAEYNSIPMSMIQSASILLGGIGRAPTATIAGDIIVIAARFVGLCLFGLLITVIGGSLHHALFGEKKK